MPKTRNHMSDTYVKVFSEPAVMKEVAILQSLLALNLQMQGINAETAVVGKPSSSY